MKKTLIVIICLNILPFIVFQQLIAQTCRTPGYNRTVIFEPVGFASPGLNDHSVPCQLASQHHQYIIDTHIQSTNPGTNPTVTLTDFINEMQTGNIGILFWHSHANNGGFGIEFYENTVQGEAACNNSWNHYVNDLGISTNFIYTTLLCWFNL